MDQPLHENVIIFVMKPQDDIKTLMKKYTSCSQEKQEEFHKK